jgi:hypothetical protein
MKNLATLIGFWIDQLVSNPSNEVIIYNQGDQIGRIFAHRVTVYFRKLFVKITEVAQNSFELLFPRKRLCIIFAKNWLSCYVLGDFSTN